jgi:hypothetical protein
MANVQSAIITPVLAAGSTANPYLYSINITQKLCSPACADNPPVFVPQYSVVGISSLGGNMYVATVRVQGLISYVPCGKTSCCAKTQPLSQTFTIPFVSETAPLNVEVTIVGSVVNEIATSACQSCSRTFVSETPLSVNIVTEAATAGN